MYGHPLLHAIVKAVVHYYPKEVFKRLRPYYRGWKILREYEIVSSFEEVEVSQKPKRIIDVMYIIRRKDSNDLYHAVFHEVKTGKYSITEVAKKYRGHWVEVPLRDRHGRVRPFHFRVGSDNPLIIWAWSEEHKRNLELLKKDPSQSDLRSHVRVRYIRLVPIEIIIPVIKRKMKETNEILQKAYEAWRPHNYSEELRELIKELPER